MKQVTTVAIDLAKNEFTLYDVDAAGNTVLRKTVRREKVMEVSTRPIPRAGSSRGSRSRTATTRDRKRSASSDSRPSRFLFLEVSLNLVGHRRTGRFDGLAKLCSRATEFLGPVAHFPILIDIDAVAIAGIAVGQLISHFSFAPVAWVDSISSSM